MGRLALAVVSLLLTAPIMAQAAPVEIVAAENFYGDVAAQVGGAGVHVTSILARPDQDPHLFALSPSVGRAVVAARIVIYNGLGYDPWMPALLATAPGNGRRTIVVADLVGRHNGDNPHIWYDPGTMLAAARALEQALYTFDPAHASAYTARLDRFIASLQPVEVRIATLKHRLAGIPVTATEPVFGYMFAALGLNVKNLRFQIAMMNNTEPGAADVAAFEHDLRRRQVALLVYNSQASSPIARRMKRIARTAGVPVIGASETEPPGTGYQNWMLGELDAVAGALPAHTQ